MDDEDIFWAVTIGVTVFLSFVLSLLIAME